MFRVFVVFLAILASFGFANASDESGAIPLAVHSASQPVNVDELLNPNHPVWVQAKGHSLRFHRTPPLYSDGPFDDGERPEASVQIVRRQSGDLYVKLQWNDATEDLFRQGDRHPDGGESHIYKTHTSKTDAFGDAACLMVPKSRKPMESYPSMMMGDKANPVDLLFWQAGRGFSLLKAHGRATTEALSAELAGKSYRTPQGWVIIFVLTDAADSIPVCFAIWEGSKAHRDGLKYYSLWYEIRL
ncbi:MAG: hypothetical protein AB1656_00290 [Candidatus Omnitrophota bacterium]